MYDHQNISSSDVSFSHYFSLRTTFTIYIFACDEFYQNTSINTTNAHWMTQSDITCKVIIFHQEGCQILQVSVFRWQGRNEAVISDHKALQT
mmetsp:Transcript_31049/g.47093  ORF Transcript_31049/g.47093 Transcript_31049/m.47093 type:complete len:92 (+) Transcript_31049:401-676(+)